MRDPAVCRLRILGPNGSFYVYFYGLQAKDLATVPNDYLREMQRRTGFTSENGYNSSVFFLEDVR